MSWSVFSSIDYGCRRMLVLRKKEAHTHTIRLLSSFLAFFSFRFFLFIHSFIYTWIQHMRRLCWQWPLLYLFVLLLYFFFSLSLFSYGRAQWILISINRSASCTSTEKTCTFFFPHSLSLLSYHTSTTIGKWYLIWICYVVRQENRPRRQNQNKRLTGKLNVKQILRRNVSRDWYCSSIGKSIKTSYIQYKSLSK